MNNSQPLRHLMGNDELFKLYGSEHYSSVWTFNQAWESGIRMLARGDQPAASAMFSRIRQEMLAIHKDLYPEDSRWR